MKKNWILVLIFTLLFSTSVFAQQEVTKVGVIDTSRVYQSYFRATTGIRNYEAKRAEFQAEVDARTAELKELQQTIFKNGKLVYNDPTIEEKREYCDKEMAKIYPEVKRTRMPHEYYVDGTKEYVDFKNNIIEETRKLVKENKNA